MDMHEITPNQRRFIEEYVLDRNATQAYLRAFGSSEYMPTYATAKSESSKLLTDPNLSAEIEARAQAHARVCGISAQRVLRELARIAFADMEDVFEADMETGQPIPRPWASIPVNARRAIRSVKVKRWKARSPSRDGTQEFEEVEIQFHDKLAALDKLFVHLGLGKSNDAIASLMSLLQAGDGTEKGAGLPHPGQAE